MDGIDGMGYDVFYGRCIEGGVETLVSLDLNSLGGGIYFSIEETCDNLLYDVKQGRKVLLYRSPGKIGRTVVTDEEAERDFKQIFGLIVSTPSSKVVTHTDGESRGHVIEERNYLPFKPEQMEELKELYQKKNVHGYPDPFTKNTTYFS